MKNFRHMQPETRSPSLLSKQIDQAPTEFSEAEVASVAGGINPQPLPPRAEPDFM